MCRSRRELSNAYLLAKIGVDTAENEPLEVWGENSIHYSLHSLARTAAREARAPPRPSSLAADCVAARPRAEPRAGYEGIRHQINKQFANSSSKLLFTISDYLPNAVGLQR